MPRRSRIALILSIFVAMAFPANAGKVEFLGSYTWQIDDPNFGGLSGLEVTNNGKRFIAITDRGTIISGHLTRAPNGALIDVEDAQIAPILDREGTPVTGADADPEGLAIDRSGRIYISFEARHRIWAYSAPNASAEDIPQHPHFARFQRNSGMEALAVDEAGRLYTLPERSGQLNRPFPVYRFDGEWSQPFSLPRDQDFMPVGADFGPDGQLYLLERAFRPPLGFYARVSRFEITETGAGPPEVLLETTAPFQNNFEGLSVWQDTEGTLQLTLLSDDNFLDVLTTEFAEYRLVTD